MSDPPPSADAEGVFTCRRCRGPLFRAAHVTSHEVGVHRFSRHRLNKDAAAGSLAPPRGGADDGLRDEAACTSFFLAEALAWMRGASEGVEGKLNCPCCAARVGTLRWAGAQCSCGTWVTPAVQIARKAVDPPRAPPPPVALEHDVEAAGGAPLSSCGGELNAPCTGGGGDASASPLKGFWGACSAFAERGLAADPFAARELPVAASSRPAPDQ